MEAKIISENFLAKALQKTHISREKIEEIINAKIKLDNEEVDIININALGEEEVVSKLDRAYAHEFGLLHRTVNAFVLTQSKKIVLQRRSHFKKAQPLCLSIYGGHLEAGSNYREGIESELKEELLDISKKEISRYQLQGSFEFIKREIHLDEEAKNNEARKLYVYQATPLEMIKIDYYRKKLTDEKLKRTREQYKSYLKSEYDKKGKGYGEVWGIYYLDLEDLRKQDSMILEDIFKPGRYSDRAEYTTDLLLPLMHDKYVMEKLAEIISR
ncbi:MAG: NUDIX domain-containing protein [Candidatus Margulisbacteria bacterium]|nr:NUDIX domain-containing protein [Candidatus Margulisiibacteriota bacterium]